MSFHTMIPSLVATVASAVLLAGEPPPRPASAGQIGTPSHLDAKTLIEQAPRRLASESTRWDTLQELAKLGTDEARALILKVALGEYGWLYEGSACTLYLHSLRDKSEARALLAAKSDNVVANTLAAMFGVPLGPELLSDFDRLTRTRGFNVRRNLASMIQLDPRGDFAEQKTKLLLAGLVSAAGLPDAQSPSRLMGWGELGWTQFGEYMSNATVTFIEAKGFDRALLERATPAAEGVERECLIVARRYRGDGSVLAEYRRVMEQVQEPGVRMTAVSLLLLLDRPAPEDRPVLERIAASDPYTFRPYPRKAGEVRKLRYPIRHYANVVLGKARLESYPDEDE